MKVTVHAEYKKKQSFEIELDDYEFESLNEYEVDNLIRDKAQAVAYDYCEPYGVSWENVSNE